MTSDILVVGAGFAGAVYARSLAEAGHHVVVIEQRDHIGGNAFDFVDENGIRVHRYGPHLFHTNNEKVVAWLQRFGSWVPYTHRVRVFLEDGRFVPMPINLTTIGEIFNVSLADEEETIRFLSNVAEPISSPQNAAEYLYSRIGRELTDLFFRRYTKKMWGIDLEEIDTSVVRRVPIRFDNDDRYFPNDRFQMLPGDGYSALFQNIFSHKNIDVALNTRFSHDMNQGFDHTFNSMPIDSYFENRFGELPYRSIRFHTQSASAALDRGWSVTNFSDEGMFTRETWWHLLPGHLVQDTGLRSITREEPCDYRDNGFERYYPVKAADGRYQEIYQKYKDLADQDQSIDFIGRCGTYQYLDMDQVINQSLMGVDRWLSRTEAVT
jgi:UDP-galactopyranose mutase